MSSVPMLQNLTDSVCNNPDFNFETFDGNYHWTNAYMFGKNTTGKEWEYCLDKANMNESQLDFFFFDRGSNWHKAMSFLEANLTDHYNCSTKPCDPNILAAI